MKHKILIVGRSANIINLNLADLQSELAEVVTATTTSEAQVLLDDSLDAVIIGAGLSTEVRLEIYKLLLKNTTHTAVFCSAKDLGVKGLEDMVTLVVHSFKT